MSTLRSTAANQHTQIAGKSINYAGAISWFSGQDTEVPMSSTCCRFIHAGDLHLQQPLGGLDTLPISLRERMISAPHAAAERVFETAILENADFMILAGGILDPQRAGPQALRFLSEQFAILQEHHVPVYWAGGRCDAPEQWPSALSLPDNVMRFTEEHPETFHVERGGEILAAIHGSCLDTATPPDYTSDPSAPFNVAIARTSSPPASWTPATMDYWALSGQTEQLVWQDDGRINFCGTTQGRSPADNGAHGCLLIEIDQHREIRRQLIPTDVVRFQSERIDWSASETLTELEAKLHERAEHLKTDSGRPPRIVTWSIDQEEPNRLPPTTECLREWVSRLRRDHGEGNSPLWTAAITFSRSLEIPSEQLQEQTILGDYLRVLRDDDPRLLPAEPAVFTEFPRDDRWLVEQVASLGLDRLRAQ